LNDLEIKKLRQRGPQKTGATRESAFRNEAVQGVENVLLDRKSTVSFGDGTWLRRNGQSSLKSLRESNRWHACSIGPWGRSGKSRLLVGDKAGYAGKVGA
jgi:hypothetical protein